MGATWLDRRKRSCITLTALVALGRLDELEMHLRVTERNGLSRDEVKEGPSLGGCVLWRTCGEPRVCSRAEGS
jgi:Carboxymuconolactone decarboxylase family